MNNHSDPSKHRFLLFRSSIVVRTTLIIFLIGTLFGLLVAISSHKVIESRENQRLQQGLIELMLAVEGTAKVAAFALDFQLAKEVAEGLIQNRSVADVELRDSTQQLIRLESQNAQNSNMMDRIILPLLSPFDDNEVIGELSILPASDRLQEDARAFSRFLGIILISVIVSLLIAVIVAVTLIVTRPIRQLSISLHELNIESQRQLITPTGHKTDEIGKLSSDINQLIQHMRQLLKMERELRENHALAERKWHLIFENAETGIFTFKQTGELIDWNPWFADVFGIRGMNQDQTILINSLLKLDPNQFQQHLKTLFSNRIPVHTELRTLTANQKNLWLHVVLNLVEEGHIQGVINDITITKLSEERALEAAQVDKLTGLFNRRGLELKFERMLNDAENSGIAIVLIDLDGFKPVNDEYGHDAGDEVLMHVASKLNNSVRKGDICVRLGGDEFVVVLYDLLSDEKADRVARKILDTIAHPYTLSNKQTIQISASIGVVYTEQMNIPLHYLLKKADTAMYKAKKSGKSRFERTNIQTYQHDADDLSS